MKIFTITCLLCVLLFPPLYPQGFTAHYDYYQGDQGSDRGVTVTAEEDGLTIVSASICTANNSGCSWVVKTDLQGNELWKIPFENLPYSVSLGWNNKLVKIQPGVYIAAGEIFHPETDFQVFLMKFDSTGSIHWRKEYGGENNVDRITNFKRLPDGNFLVYLSTILKSSPVSQRKTLLKLNPSGEFIWEKDLDNPLFQVEFGGNFDVLPNGDIWMTYTYKKAQGIFGTWFTLADSLGNIKWEKQIMPFVSHCGERVAYLPNGYLAVSYCVDNESLLTYTDQVIEVLDLNGNFVWRQEFRSPTEWPLLNHFIIAANGDMIGCGVGLTDDQLEAAWLVRISPEGVLRWERKFVLDGHLNDAPSFNDVDELPDGRIAAVSHIVDSAENGPLNSNVWLVVVDSAGCLLPGCQPEQVDVLVDVKSPPGENPPSHPNRYFRAGPNPGSGQLTIDFIALPQNEGRLELFAPDGRMIRRTVVRQGATGVEWNTALFPPGFYLLRFSSGGQTLQTEKIILSHRS